jgi:hypothetical protein
MELDEQSYKLKLLKELEIKQELEKRKRVERNKNNFKDFAKDQLRIITKDASQGYVEFEFNEAQTKIHKAIEKQIKEKGRVRALVLKARQQGISTYTAGRVFWKTFYTAHTRSVVIAHDSATSDALFTMSKNFIDRMSDDFKPELVRSNAKEVKFSHNDSGYRLYTAGSPEAGRGTTPTILHCSECAFWQNDDKILAGLFQGVSSSDGTEIILESTANGATGAFYRMWKAAERGENDYVPIFLPWFMTKEYTMDPPDNFERTIEENEIAEEYDLSDGQLWWRRMKIGEGGESKFRQEYPSTAEEAFVVSGKNVFNVEKLNKLETKAPKALREFNPSMSSWEDHREGNLSIWESPGFDEKFIIGADVSLGVGQDYSAAIVLNKDRQVVAVYRDNHVDPAVFGRDLFYLGRYFNNALLAVESNSMGVSTLQKLKEMKYVNLYYQTQIANLTDEDGVRLGFRTTSASKPAIISNLKNWIDNDELAIWSTDVVNELRDYVSDDKGKTNASKGSTDDTVMSLAIAAEVYRTHINRLSTSRVGFDSVYIPERQTNWI